MNGVKVQALADAFDPTGGRLGMTVASWDRPECEHVLRPLLTKTVTVQIAKWYKPRTTGEESQNHRLNGFVRQFCNWTGNDFADIKLFVKRRAMRRGLNPMLDRNGKIVYSKVDGEPLPKSEADMNTVECGWCIDEIEQLAAEEGVTLVER